MKPNDRAGLLFALTGFAILSIGDAVVKSMAGQWAPTAVAALRYAMGASGLGVLLFAREGRAGFAMPVPGAQLLRAFAVSVSTVAFFSAVFVMPLSDATSISFTSPMLTALLAAALLGEPARRSTWIASLVAFTGVLIILRPNFAELGWAALFPLASALGMSVLMIGNRFVAGKASPLAMQFYIAIMATPILLSAALAGHYSEIERFAVHWPSIGVVARCAFIAVSATIAHWLIFMGTTRAGAATIAPMTYVQLLVAALLGYVLFGDLPDGLALIGAAIIIAAGLYLWWAGQTPPEPAGAETA